MIVATGAGVDVIGVLGLIAVVIIPLSLLATFIIKALIYKTISPVKVKQTEQDKDMELLKLEVATNKANNEKILEKLDKLPGLISDTIKKSLDAQEKLYDLKYTHQKKQ